MRFVLSDLHYFEQLHINCRNINLRNYTFINLVKLCRHNINCHFKNLVFYIKYCFLTARRYECCSCCFRTQHFFFPFMQDYCSNISHRENFLLLTFASDLFVLILILSNSFNFDSFS